MKRVIVVGGGITGLAAAYRLSRLSQQNYQVTLLEASDRLGGKILTDHSNNCVLELGPDSFMTTKPHALSLIRELGLESQLVGTDSINSDIFVYVRGRMRRIPEGLLLAPSKLLPFLRSDLFTWKGKLRVACDWFLPANNGGDESMGHFARRRFGEETLKILVQPVMAGIYAGDADTLSMKSTFPRFLEMEHQYGSVIRGLRRSAIGKQRGDRRITTFMTLSKGLDELTQALAREVGPSVKTGANVHSITADSSGYCLAVGSGENLTCDALIITTPAWQTAEMVSEFDDSIALELRAIPFTSSATVSVAYNSSSLPDLPRGFGFVVAKDESEWISAATFSSSKFPGRTSHETFLIRCFVSGAGSEEILRCDDGHIVDGALSDLKRILGIAIRPKITRLRRWPRANPQYTVGHDERLRRITAVLGRHKGLWLAGASYRGVGIPDCIASGFEASEAAHAYLLGRQG